MAKKKYKAHGVPPKRKTAEEEFKEAKEVYLIKVKALIESIDTVGIFLRLAGASKDVEVAFGDPEKALVTNDIISYRKKIKDKLDSLGNKIDKLEFDKITKEKLPEELCFDITEKDNIEDIKVKYMCENIMTQLIDRFYQMKSLAMNQENSE